MTQKLTKAARRALAYVRLTGCFPGHLRSRTWHAVFNMVEMDLDRADRGRLGPYAVKPEFVGQAEAHPMCKAGRVLESLGFRVDLNWHYGHRSRRKASYVSYSQDDADPTLPAGDRVDHHASAHDNGSYYATILERRGADKDRADPTTPFDTTR